MAYLLSTSVFLARGARAPVQRGLVPPPGYKFLRTQDGKLILNRDGTYRVVKVS